MERIRNATFPPSRRGYDKREVEKFLNRLADWLETGGGDQARSDTVRRELERVGQRTGAILSQAEDSAQQIRGEAEQEMAQLRAEAAAEAEQHRSEADAYAAEARASADSYSQETRAEADGYARQTRAEADEYARQTRSAADQDADQIRTQAEEDVHQTVVAAEAQARRTIDEGISRRRDIESVIGDLASRRDLAVAELESLRVAVEAAISDHKPSGEDPFAASEETDPLGETVEIESGHAQAQGFEEFEDDPATSQGNR
ncbi:MAG: DivIVA domain-containing protein [Solirubrobacterales bacterium]